MKVIASLLKIKIDNRTPLTTQSSLRAFVENLSSFDKYYSRLDMKGIHGLIEISWGYGWAFRNTSNNLDVFQALKDVVTWKSLV